jgi:hypothetical protein
MAQVIRQQIIDATSTSGGNLTLPATSGINCREFTGLLICIAVTSATTGAITTNALREDGSTVLIKTAASLAVTAGDWSFSLGDYVQPPGASAPPFLPPRVQILVVGATTSVARVTVWGIKLTG